MGTRNYTKEEAELLLGRKLKVTETVMINVFGDDAEYNWYKDEKGNLAASKTGKGESLNK